MLAPACSVTRPFVSMISRGFCCQVDEGCWHCLSIKQLRPLVVLGDSRSMQRLLSTQSWHNWFPVSTQFRLRNDLSCTRPSTHDYKRTIQQHLHHCKLVFFEVLLVQHSSLLSQAGQTTTQQRKGCYQHPFQPQQPPHKTWCSRTLHDSLHPHGGASVAPVVPDLMPLRNVIHFECLSRVCGQGILRQTRHARPHIHECHAETGPACTPQAVVVAAAAAIDAVSTAAVWLLLGLQAFPGEVHGRHHHTHRCSSNADTTDTRQARSEAQCTPCTA